jgi:hypothetical protein
MKLSAEPDGFGFFYGWVERNGERVRVDVLPPDHLWRGDIKLKGQKPDPKAWVLYLVGHGNIATTSGYLHARPESSSGLKLDQGVFLQ